VFLFLSKVLFFFIRPSNALLFLLIIGVVLLVFGWRRAGLWLTGMATVLLLVAGLGPTANLLFQPLETRFPHTEITEPIAGIVVLGGALDTVIAEEHGVPVLAEAGERVVAAAVLARAHPAIPIVLSGGKPALFPGALTEADETVKLLTGLGVDPARLVVENGSRNTFENAVNSKEVAKPQPGERWVLVTSAYHMPRAIGVFRAAGWPEMVAYPVDYRSAGTWRPYPSVAKGLRYTDVAVREWIGLLAYRLTGRTGVLLPAP